MNEPTYCKSCGAYIPEGQKKCLACGAFVGEGDSTNITEGFKIYADGYELNERGEILSVPNEKFGTTTQYDPVPNLAASLYYKAQQEQVDIDLDNVFSKTWFTVKLGGNTSTFYLGSNPKVVCEDCELSGRTIDGRIQRDIATKRKIKLTLIER